MQRQQWDAIIKCVVIWKLYAEQNKMRSIWSILIFLCGIKNLWAGFNRWHIPSVGLSATSIQAEKQSWGVWWALGIAPKPTPKFLLALQSELTASERFSGSLYWSGCCKILSSVTKNWIASLTIVGRYCLTFALKVFSLKSCLYISSLIKVRTFQRYKTTQNWQLCCDWWR